jgi:heptosyltransferase-2
MKKILVIQTAFLGDAILTTPVFRELKKIVPDCKIHALVNKNSVELLKNDPNIDRIIAFDKKNGKFINFIKTVRLIKKNRYDEAFSMNISFTSSLLMLLGSIPVRVGPERMNFLTHPVKFSKKGLHIRKRAVELLKKRYPENAFDDSTKLYLSEKDKENADSIIKNLKYKNIIGIAPGSVRGTKRWPEEYFTELLKLLSAKKISVITLGSRNEKELCDKIIRKSGNLYCENLAGELSLTESAAVIEKLDLLISNDSAPLHMANAINTPVYAFFGPTVKRFGCYPYREKDKILEVDLECRPCGTHGGKKCPLDHHNCMKNIKPEFVRKLIGDFYNV